MIFKNNLVKKHIFNLYFIY